jgi:hypothetical protein
MQVMSAWFAQMSMDLGKHMFMLLSLTQAVLVQPD